MGDAKEILGLILGLPKRGERGSTEKRKAPRDGGKKPDGVHKEVYELAGSLPPLMPTLGPVSTKQRKVPAEKERVVDGSSSSGDYAFVKYNTAVDVVRYTDEEYNQLLFDPSWSKEETDQLFDMCEQFDLRFTVIADRFTSLRTIEELRHRYYSVAKSILQARAGLNDDLSGHPLFKNSYNFKHEVKRKGALNIMFQSRQQDREDKEIIEEARRITEARLKEKELKEAQVPAGAAFHVDTTPARTPEETQHISYLIISAGVAATTYVQVYPVPTRASAPPLTPIQIPSPRLAPMPAPAPDAPLPVGPRPVHSKAKVPIAAVCAEHLQLRKELLNLLQLQKQVQRNKCQLAILRENPHADIPATPNTPKRPHRGLENERVSTRTTTNGAEFEGFPGGVERVGKREHKRKAPTSPPYQKRGLKMKGSES